MYLSYDNIIRTIEEKLQKYSYFLKKEIIGQTNHKQSIVVLKLSMGIAKYSIFIEGGEQGREWTTSAIILKLLDMLLKKDEITKTLMENYDFYLLPILNPDGYEYSIRKVIFFSHFNKYHKIFSNIILL